MLAQLREMIVVPPSSNDNKNKNNANPAAVAVGASAMMGVTASNFLRSSRGIGETAASSSSPFPSSQRQRRNPTLGDEGIDPGTVDAEVVDAGDGDADDSWSAVLRNSGELETMVRALLEAPAAAGSSARKGASPGQREKEKRKKNLVAAIVGGGVVAVAAAVAAGVLGFGGGGKKEREGEKEKKKTTTRK